MVVCCCVRGCSNDWKPTGELRFHRFPMSNNELCIKWIESLNLENFTPKSHSRICSAHFVQEDYYHSKTPAKRLLLKPNAVPSIILEDDIQINCILESTLNEDDESKLENLTQLTFYSENFFLDDTNNVLSNLDTNVKRKDSEEEETESNVRTVSTQTFKDITPRLLETKISSRRKIKILQQKLKRRNEKILRMRKYMTYFRKEELAKEKMKNTLKRSFDGFSAELLKHQYKNHKVKPKQRRYSEAMKTFSVKLYLYSPTAYKFVRNYLQLPHFRSLVRNQHVCEEP